MREDEMNKIVSGTLIEEHRAALRDAPPAPEELRHNVMAAIHELEYAPLKRKSKIFKAVPALACVAVFAVVVVVARPMLQNSKSTNMSADNIMRSDSSFDGGGGSNGSADTMNAGDAAGSIEPGTFSVQEWEEAPPQEDAVARDDVNIEYALASDPDSAGATYVVTGEIPEELDELECIVNPDASRVYENVPDEIIELLLANNSYIAEAPVAGAGNVVKWMP